MNKKTVIQKDDGLTQNKTLWDLHLRVVL